MPRTLLLLSLLLAGCNLFSQAPVASEDMGGGTDVDPTPDMPQSDLSGEADLGPADVGNRDLGNSDLGPMDMGSGDMPADLGANDLGSDTGPDDMDIGMDAGVDMPPDMPSTDPCQWPDTLFCSGFEDSAFSDWEGTFDDMCGITHETTIVHSGTGAMRAEVLQGNGNCGTYFDSINPPIDNGDEVWIRAWIYLPTSLDLDHFEWVGLANFTTDEEVNASIWASGVDGHFHLDGYEGYPQGSFAVPRDQWLCFEWHIEFDGQAGRSFVAVDGVPRVDVGALPLTLLGPLDAFGIGQVWTGDNQQGEVYFDDIFLGRSRPGCD